MFFRNNECEITMHRVLSMPGKYVGDNCFVLGNCHKNTIISTQGVPNMTEPNQSK